MMKSMYSNLMQSRFFNPVFNSAIYDGPIRIYFAQLHETQALKIYFSMQNNFLAELNAAREISKITGSTILVMLYPNTETFSLSFSEAPNEQIITRDLLGEDSVIGVRGPVEDTHMDHVLENIVNVISHWKTQNPLIAQSQYTPSPEL